MKNRIVFFTILIAGFFIASPVLAKDEMREVSPFSKISLRISAKVYLKQGDKQSVKIVADPETLEEIITEVKDRTLQIRYPSDNIFKRWDPGKIEIFITVPEVDGLTL